MKDFLKSLFFKEELKLIEKLQKENLEYQKLIKNKKLKCIKSIKNENINLHKSINKRFNSILLMLFSVEKLKQFNIYDNDFLKKLNLLEENFISILNIDIKYKTNIAITGAFSSGKSSLINSILGKKICPTADKELTSIVTKFYFAPKETITFNKREITFKEYQQIANGEVQKEGIIEYGYPNPVLKDINLYDVPGFDGVNENNYKKALSIMKDIDLIFYLIDINTGASKSSDINNLNNIEKNLKDLKKEKYCIITKIDMETEENILKVLNEIKEKDIFDDILLSTTQNNKIDLFFEKCNSDLKYKLENFEDINIILKTEIKQGKISNKYKFLNPYVEIQKSDILNYKKINKVKDDISVFIEYLASEKEYQFLNKILNEIQYLNEELNDILDNLKFKKTNYLENFENDLSYLEKKLYAYFYDLISLKETIVMTFANNLKARKASKKEKDYWSTPYAKIINNFNDNNETIIQIIHEITTKINESIKEFNEKYSLNLKIYSHIEIQTKLFDFYLLHYWKKSLIKDNGDYFYDIDKAKEALKEIKKKLINNLDKEMENFLLEDLEKYKNDFDFKKGYLFALDEIEDNKIEQLKKEIEKIKKEIKNVTKL